MNEKTKSKINLSLKAYGKGDPKPKINWEDKKEREELLSLLVSDARKVLSYVDNSKEDLDLKLKDAANLLAKIVSQDTEEDETGRPRIKRGIAKDRVISTTDPEMRHGRKSSAGKFNGYKTHITKDVDSNIITNIDVSPGNFPDGDMAQPLIKEAKEEFGIKTRSLTGDGAYGSGKMRKEMSNEGIELISKTPVPKDTGKITKEEFDVDLEKEKVRCPEEETTTKCHKSKNPEGEIAKTFVFPKKVCQACPRKDECTSAKHTGRRISVGPYEEYLQKAREIQKTEEFKKIYNQRRPPIERKIAELISHGLHKARYIGKRKSRLQALFTAAVVNLKLIFKEQQDKKIKFDIFDVKKRGYFSSYIEKNGKLATNF